MDRIPKALNGEDASEYGDSVRAGVRADLMFRSYSIGQNHGLHSFSSFELVHRLVLLL